MSEFSDIKVKPPVKKLRIDRKKLETMSVNDKVGVVDMKELTLDDIDMMVKEYNESIGNKNTVDKIDCPICKNKEFVAESYIDHNTKIKTMVLRPCKCVKRREMMRKAYDSGLNKYLNMRFENFEKDEPWQQEMYDKAVEYVKDVNRTEWFTLLGQSGAGKTMIASIICNYLLSKGKEVQYETWTDFISQLKRDMISQESKEVSGYWKKIKEVEVLFLDEVLKGEHTEYELKYLVELINYRYRNELKTIITSEKNINDLLDIDEATFSRVVERSNDYLINIHKDKKRNYRLRSLKK